MIQKLATRLFAKFNIDVTRLAILFNRIIYLQFSLNLPKNQEIIDQFAKLYYNQAKIGGSWNNDSNFLNLGIVVIILNN